MRLAELEILHDEVQTFADELATNINSQAHVLYDEWFCDDQSKNHAAFREGITSALENIYKAQCALRRLALVELKKQAKLLGDEKVFAALKEHEDYTKREDFFTAIESPGNVFSLFNVLNGLDKTKDF